MHYYYYYFSTLLGIAVGLINAVMQSANHAAARQCIKSKPSVHTELQNDWKYMPSVCKTPGIFTQSKQSREFTQMVRKTKKHPFLCLKCATNPLLSAKNANLKLECTF